MAQEVVTIKGTRQGLVIQFKGESDLEEIKEALKAKLEEARGFFRGARFILSPSRPLTTGEASELEELCRHYGLLPARETATPSVRPASKLPTILKELTLRSGQELTVEGDLVLLGNVHRGAIVRASGSIFILGRLKGTAHAGYRGNTSAIILALEMQPSQLRIASTVAVPPGPEEVRPYPEIARLSSGRIVVEPYRKGVLPQNIKRPSPVWARERKRPYLTPRPHPQYVP
ncbi:MAG: hypothetical protein L5656_06060 [Thermanaeromonas sp.]|uniref:septum site-determining protein MinC n=1 Tax=Thermanaeromonas sp. TaxID=2003697 RepID=UPI0024380980|nr:septum site-determining protein MinC [Thermanaeromonas sp.]MCG0278079.1 hypothetical protein [Thermanaeromonas sp.]